MTQWRYGQLGMEVKEVHSQATLNRVVQNGVSNDFPLNCPYSYPQYEGTQKTMHHFVVDPIPKGQEKAKNSFS